MKIIVILILSKNYFFAIDREFRTADAVSVSADGCPPPPLSVSSLLSAVVSSRSPLRTGEEEGEVEGGGHNIWCRGQGLTIDTITRFFWRIVYYSDLVLFSDSIRLSISEDFRGKEKGGRKKRKTCSEALISQDSCLFYIALAPSLFKFGINMCRTGILNVSQTVILIHV